MRDLIGLLLELNLALAGAVGFVACLRGFFRQWFGPRAAYGLWWAVPVALVAVCVPREGALSASAGLGLFAVREVQIGLLLIWLGGMLVSALAMVVAQRRFAALERRGEAGPALIGVLVGRLVMPADADRRWSQEEVALIRAHERAHRERGDLRVNAVVAGLRCLFWFNPLAHVGAGMLRFDQELACDATVMAGRPGRRRLYAEALLKAGSASASPLGCGWTQGGVGALEARLQALRLSCWSPSSAGLLFTVAVLAVTAGTAWRLQPPTPEAPQARPGIVLNLRLLPPVQAR
jgi:beta-lactamase regulating signal transducer with metallopeptidase domain